VLLRQTGLKYAAGLYCVVLYRKGGIHQPFTLYILGGIHHHHTSPKFFMFLREDPLKNFPSIRRRKRVSTSNYYMYTTEKCTFWQVMILEANRHKIIWLFINTYAKDIKGI